MPLCRGHSTLHITQCHTCRIVLDYHRRTKKGSACTAIVCVSSYKSLFAISMVYVRAKMLTWMLYLFQI